MALWIPAETLARRWGGQVRRNGWLNSPSIHFAIQGRNAILEFANFHAEQAYPSRYQKTLLTELSVDLKSAVSGSFKIGQRGVAGFLSGIFGRPPFRVGDRFFDELYIVHSEPEELARSLFAPGQRDRVIASVRRLGTYVDPRIDLSFGRLNVQVSELLEHERGVQNLLDTTTDFVGYLLERRSPDPIVWGDAGEDLGGKCPVCGAPLESPVITCGGCRTP